MISRLMNDTTRSMRCDAIWYGMDRAIVPAQLGRLLGPLTDIVPDLDRAIGRCRGKTLAVEIRLRIMLCVCMEIS